MVSIPFQNHGSNTDNMFKNNNTNEASGLVPPQNIQAEESVLGGILLSGLLTTPDNGDEKYDHKVNINVIGSKILLNQKPLI